MPIRRFINPVKAIERHEAVGIFEKIAPFNLLKGRIKHLPVWSTSELSIKAPPVHLRAPMFNGSSTYMYFGSVEAVPDASDWTIEFWVYRTKVDEYYTDLFVQGTGSSNEVTEIYFYTNYLCLAHGVAMSVERGYVWLPVHEWTHVAFIHNSSEDTYSLLRNGYEAGYYDISRSWNLNSGTFMGAGTGFWGFSSGAWNEFRIWNTVRTAQQVRDNMYHPVNPSSAGLRVYWKLDDGGPNIQDSGPNSYHGTAYREIGWFPPR